mmetsp:Transcript_42764/g.103899  ORF Transcript_42764/g.103899 Transcript_42764/m.103899 type:complete len:231 (+) Transcript_42764:893-1585(+)
MFNVSYSLPSTSNFSPGRLRTNSMSARPLRYGRPANSAGGLGVGYFVAMISSSLESCLRESSLAAIAADASFAAMLVSTASTSVLIVASSVEASALSLLGTALVIGSVDLSAPFAFCRAPFELEKSSRCRLSCDSSRAAWRSRICFGCPGRPRRSSEFGSLFTRLPEPEASSLACAIPTGVMGEGGSGENKRMAASAEAAAERTAASPLSVMTGCGARAVCRSRMVVSRR